MKRLLLLLVCVLIILLQFGGCQGSGVNKGGNEAVITNGRFPQSLAGTWKADDSKWQVTLAPDGNVVSVANDSGSLMVIAEGGLFEEGPTEGTFLYLTFGPCYTNYIPTTRELSVTVTLEDFHMQLPDTTFEADMKYYITGPISEDGKKWDALLFHYISPKGKRPTDPNRVAPQFFVFNKVETNQLGTPANQ